MFSYAKRCTSHCPCPECPLQQFPPCGKKQITLPKGQKTHCIIYRDQQTLSHTVTKSSEWCSDTTCLCDESTLFPLAYPGSGLAPSQSSRKLQIPTPFTLRVLACKCELFVMYRVCGTSVRACNSNGFSQVSLSMGRLFRFIYENINEGGRRFPSSSDNSELKEGRYHPARKHWRSQAASLLEQWSLNLAWAKCQRQVLMLCHTWKRKSTAFAGQLLE